MRMLPANNKLAKMGGRQKAGESSHLICCRTDHDRRTRIVRAYMRARAHVCACASLCASASMCVCICGFACTRLSRHALRVVTDCVTLVTPADSEHWDQHQPRPAWLQTLQLSGCCPAQGQTPQLHGAPCRRSHCAPSGTGPADSTTS